MTALAFTKEVKTFIDENISGYEDLQILLLMHSHPGKKWDVADIADQLRIEPILASKHLLNLHARGLIGHNSKRGLFYDFQYAPLPEWKAVQVNELARAFDKARTEVVDYIFAKERMQPFADAFKFKKE